LLNSISIAEREEGLEGIADVIRCEESPRDHQYDTACPREKAGRGRFVAGIGNFGVNRAGSVQQIDSSLPALPGNPSKKFFEG